MTSLEAEIRVLSIFLAVARGMTLLGVGNMEMHNVTNGILTITPKLSYNTVTQN
jgi:hypothetical protein